MAMAGGKKQKNKAKGLGRTGSIGRSGSLRKGGAWKSAMAKMKGSTQDAHGAGPSSKALCSGLSPSPSFDKEEGEAHKRHAPERLILCMLLVRHAAMYVAT